MHMNDEIRMDLNKGLSSEEVEDLNKAGMVNYAVKPPSKSIGQIILTNLCTYFNLIFLVLSILLIWVHSFINLTFLPIIICNTLIGIIQELRSKKVLDELNMLNAPKTTVIRDSRETVIDSHKLVLGDVVIFMPGNQICADAIIGEGVVQVNESLITGESDEITKKAGDRLLSGSFVVSGQCKAVLEHVGEDSYISKLTLEAKKSKGVIRSEMMKSLDKIVKYIGIIIIPIGLTMFIQQYVFLGLSRQESVVAMVAALIGMIPEGLYLLASVALVVSVMRLAGKKVLVHELGCIETLARVDVLCVDKTGTITENAMKVQSVVEFPNAKEFCYADMDEMLGDYAAASHKDNATMAAVQEYFIKTSGKQAVSITNFSSVTKFSGVTYEDGSYVLGAPEMILKDNYKNYEKEIIPYSLDGYRVLLFAKVEGDIDGHNIEGKINPVAMVLITNPIRKEAKATFEYFEEQGVEIKVISGDNPATVSNVAVKAGVARADRYVDASTLNGQEDIDRAVSDYTVFGRVTPEQKRMFVKALKKQGKTVAMTGDGVNDVLALKDADCSVAMASGSDAAANASQIVLLDSDFSAMPDVVLEGRRVVNNIQRSASLFLVKNIFSMLMAFFTVILALQYPLKPTQLSLLGLFTIGTPAFFLAMQPNKSLIKGRFITNVLLKAMPAGITDFISVALLTALGPSLGLMDEQLSTIAIYIMLSVGLATLFRACYPFNALRIAVMCVMAGGTVFCAFFLKPLFALTVLNMHEVMVATAFIIGAIVLLLVLSVIMYVIEHRIKQRNGKKN